MELTGKVKVDPFYKDNLTEWIYDEHKLITYRYLSVTLGVHVNIAKQMLYEFYTEEKKKQEKSGVGGKSGNKISATYLLSGTQLESEDSEVFNLRQVICSEDKLEEQKKRMKDLYSIHIYSLQEKNDQDCLAKLKAAAAEATFLKDQEGRTGVDFGPFKLMKPEKVAVAVRPAPAPESTTQKSKSTELRRSRSKSKLDENANSKKSSSPPPAPVVKKEEKEKEKKEKSENGTGTTKKTTATTSTAKSKASNSVPAQNSDRLKNMFAAAALKPPKPKKKSDSPVKKIDSSDSEEEDVEEVEVKPPARRSYGRKTPKPAASKATKKVEPASKRRRIQVFTSSEDEDNDDKEESEGEPESPIARGRKLDVESDSDDFSESPIKKSKEKTPEPTPCPTTGKKRVSKVVCKTYMDEDGYVLTVKDKILVSASEESDPNDEEPVPKLKSEPKKPKLEIKEEKSKQKKEKDSSTSPSPQKKKPVVPKAIRPKKTDANDQKMKQASLTSFFKKKP